MKRSVNIPDELHDWLVQQSLQRDRSVNYIVVQALQLMRGRVIAAPASELGEAQGTFEVTELPQRLVEPRFKK